MRLPSDAHENGACCGACEFAGRVESGELEPPEPGARLAPNQSYQLVVTLNGSIDVYPLSAAPCKIGRSPQNDVTIHSGKVSRWTCEISQTDQGVHLRDVGSSCGTYVNGEKIDETLLGQGDKIYLADAILEVIRA